MSHLTSVSCKSKTNNTFVDSLFVKNTVFTDRIAPRNGNSITIEGLDLACQNLTDTKTELGCGASNGDGFGNTSVGVNAGNSLTSGIGNTLIGFETGKTLTTGIGNVGVGLQSLLNATDANRNIGIGDNTLRSLNSGEDNISLGSGSGFNLTSGNGNITIGVASGIGIDTGSNNLIIGHNSGSNVSSTLSNNVLIGNEVGQNNTVDNRLMIDITNTDDPLIDGRFDSRKVRINDSLELDNINITSQLEWSGAFQPSISPTPDSSGAMLPIQTSLGVKYIRLYDL